MSHLPSVFHLSYTWNAPQPPRSHVRHSGHGGVRRLRAAEGGGGRRRPQRALGAARRRLGSLLGPLAAPGRARARISAGAAARLIPGCPRWADSDVVMCFVFSCRQLLGV